VDVARKLDVPKMLMLINKIPQSFDLNDVRHRVEEIYKVNVIATLPHSEEMMALASSGIFSLKYPDHPITNGLKAVVAELQG
jgi:septum site-determining protein MinD